MAKEFYSKLEKLLKKDLRFVDREGDLLKSNIIDAAYKADKKLVELLFSQREFKSKFFSKIKDVLVFNINDFVNYVQDKNFLADSYTKYRNKMGLNIDGKFLNERKEVVLVWPFKDCVLEGGMLKEDEKRKEIFFNEILAQDEIDKLFVPKVLTDWKRYTVKGEEKVKELKRDADGTIRENLIIKGNNLLALHSLKTQFQGRVKLIFIDPPYNFGGNFPYNNNFNESTWLTFMKNRLEVAYTLLRSDGAIYVSIDHHENHVLKMLLKEIFKDNFIQEITVKTADPAGFKIVNPGPVEVTEYIYVFAKNKEEYLKTEKRLYIKDFGVIYPNIIINREEGYKKWKIESTKRIALQKLGFNSEKDLVKKYGIKAAKALLISELEALCIKKANSVFTTYKPDNPSPKMLDIAKKSLEAPTKFIEYKKQDGNRYYLLNGRIVAFYSSRLKDIDGEVAPARHLTNLWTDISWSSVDKERKVKLPRGKKPEKLLKRILDLCTGKEDIVLDFFLGSGTTCGVSHKMGRQYIGIEQLDYQENDPVFGLKNVIAGDQTGISKLVGWKGGGDFVYCELMKYNEYFVEKIKKAKNKKELLKIWGETKEKSFLNYNIDIKKFDETIDEFEKLPIDKQKHILFEILNKNQLYVNLSEIDDKEFKVSEEDKKINKEFYRD